MLTIFDIRNHLCERFKDLQHPTEYTLLAPEDYSAVALNRADPVNIYLLASKMKWAIPKLYPGT